MCEMIKPLAVSAHITCMPGEVFCFSLHQNVINLIDSNQKIITLHSVNRGISPMGWVIKSDDFFAIHDMIAQQRPAINRQVNGDLVIGELTLSNQCRKLNLTVLQPFTVQKKHVYCQLSSIRHKTGLFGELASVLTQPLNQDLQSLMTQIIHFINHRPFDLDKFIGLGPGLTPTFDDILVGIFSALYTDSSLRKRLPMMHLYLGDSKLELLTTKISATFLSYAFKGIFTLNLLAVISSIRQYNQHGLSIKKLLGYGHSSGADLLLGIWIGSLILEQYYHDKKGLTC